VPSLGHIAASLGAALAVTLLFLLWIGWPGFLAVGAGAVFGVAFLVVATSLGVDPRAADEAWRHRARDLVPSRGDATEGDPDSDPERSTNPASTTDADEGTDGLTQR
jgi:hypothetical protein